MPSYLPDFSFVMDPFLKSGRTFFLFLFFSLPCCTFQLQQQIDAQQQAISLLQQKSQQANKSLANYQNELDKIKLEIQSAKGLIEENSHHTKKGIAELKDRMDQLSASVKIKQQEMEHLRKQVGSLRAPEKPKQVGSLREPEKPKQDSPSISISDEQVLYNQAFDYFKSGKYSNALRSFEKFLSAYPNSALADNALYWVGNCYFKDKEFERAISAFDDVIKKFPNGNKVPDAYYLQALAFYELKDALTAQLIFETLIQNFPSSQPASLAKQKIEELKAATSP